jgi:hypothetical protein
LKQRHGPLRPAHLQWARQAAPRDLARFSSCPTLSTTRRTGSVQDRRAKTGQRLHPPDQEARLISLECVARRKRAASATRRCVGTDTVSPRRRYQRQLPPRREPRCFFASPAFFPRTRALTCGHAPRELPQGLLPETLVMRPRHGGCRPRRAAISCSGERSSPVLAGMPTSGVTRLRTASLVEQRSACTPLGGTRLRASTSDPLNSALQAPPPGLPRRALVSPPRLRHRAGATDSRGAEPPADTVTPT